MKKFFYGLAILLCTACQQSNVPADKIAIDGIYENGNTAELELCLRPLGGMTYTDAIMMKDSANTFTGEFPVSETGFYGMYGILNGGQLTVPVYLPKGGKIYELTLRNENGVPMLELDKDNEALSAYNKFIYRHGQDFWMNGKNIPSEALQAYVARYMVVADSIANEYRCSKPVKEYMQLWAATSMESMYNSLPRTLGVKKADLPFTKEELLAGATECYKSPIASCFPSVTQSIALTLPDGSLSEKLAYVYENYTYPGTQMRVVEIVMSGYIGRFNYAENFEQGLAELNEVVSRFKLDEKYVADFTKRRASAKGAPFPKDVTLTDADGKPMDISMFKGNYVYVDLWASWCVP